MVQKRLALTVQEYPPLQYLTVQEHLTLQHQKCGSLVDSHTPGSSTTSQLAEHTPVLPKEANSKHIELNSVVASEVTLDTVVHNI